MQRWGWGRQGRKEACTHTTHCRVEARVGYRCGGVARGSRCGVPAPRCLVYTHMQETQTRTPKRAWVPTQLRNDVGMQTRTGVCCVYTNRHRHIYRGCRDVLKRVHTHTRTHTNTHAHASTHKGFIFRCARPNPGGRERV